MITNHAADIRIAAPPDGDDFQRIDGIGQGIAKRLHRAGVYTFVELAEQAPEQLAELIGHVGGLSAERIIREGWIDQARELAAEQASLQKGQATDAAESVAVFEDTDIAGIRRHNATFTTKLVLNEKNEVQYTRMVHFESQMEEAWAGWQVARLVDFFAQQARLPHRSAEIAAPSAVSDEPTPFAPLVSIDSLNGTLRLHDLEVRSIGAIGSRGIVAANQRIAIHLALDLSDIGAPGDMLLHYTVTISAKNLAGGQQYMIVESNNVIASGGARSIAIEGIAPPPGIYRLEAAATLVTSPFNPSSSLAAFLEGGLLQVCSAMSAT